MAGSHGADAHHCSHDIQHIFVDYGIRGIGDHDAPMDTEEHRGVHEEDVASEDLACSTFVAVSWMDQLLDPHDKAHQGPLGVHGVREVVDHTVALGHGRGEDDLRNVHGIDARMLLHGSMPLRN